MEDIYPASKLEIAICVRPIASLKEAASPGIIPGFQIAAA
jgi:hypothetical protein